MLTLLYGADALARRCCLHERLQTTLAQGKKVLWFVPEQQVLEAEGVMAAFDASRLGEVSSFARMANTVFRRFGGLRYHYIGKGAKQLLLWRALLSVSSSLYEYGNVSFDDMATVRLLFDTVEELKLYLITPEDLERVAAETEDEAFKKKLSDIALIYAAYSALLHEEHDDAADDLLRAVSLCEGKGVFADTVVFFDSFDGFTPNEMMLLRVIFSEAEAVYATLAYDPETRRDFTAKLSDTDRRLRKLAADTCRRVESFTAACGEGVHPEIAYFRDNYGKRLPDAYPDSMEKTDVGIRAVACPGVYEEVRLIASDIKRRVMEGARYRDFAIVARESDRYLGILDAALEGAGIPYFISERRDVTAMSTARMLLTALRIHARFWQREDVIAFLRSGLSPLTADECDAIEEYVEAWKISGKRFFDDYGWQMNPFGFSAPYDEAAEERLVYLNALREKLILPLKKLFEVFETPATVRDITVALVTFLQEMNVAEKIAAKGINDGTASLLREKEEYLLLHDTLMKAFDELCEAVGDLSVSAREYASLFTVLLSEADMGALPLRLDEVTVGSASLFRKNGIKHIYLMGLSEGEFPKAISDNGCFDDGEKEILLLHGVETAPLAARRILDEKLYFYRALTSATDSVTMTYAYGDLSGKEAFPSSAYLDTLSLLNDKEEERYDDLDMSALLYGESEILEYAVLNGYDVTGLGLLSDSQFAISTPLDAKDEALPREVTRTLYGEKIRLSQSKTDSFSRCPFAYHCKYTLSLSEGVSGQFDSLDIGTFIHEILEAFFSRFKDRVKEMSDEEAKDGLSVILQDFSKKLLRDNRSKRFESLLRRLHRTTELLVMNLLGEFRQSDFTPVLFEEKIFHSEDVALDSLDISETLTVNLSGVVDRADIYRVGDDVYLRVVDYKTGSKRFSMAEVEMGFQLQLLVYLFALTQGASAEIKKKLDLKGEVLPAGALYFSLGAKAVSTAKMPEDEALSRAMIEKEIKRSGIFLNLPDVLNAMEKDLGGYYIPITLSKSGEPTKGRSTSELQTLEEMGALAQKVSGILQSIAKAMATGDAAARPKAQEKGKDPCQYCKMKPICRVRYRAEAEEGGDG